MTGKEALDELMETFYELCEECDCNEDMYQKHNLTSPHHIIRKELDELAKYKRAFEILKDTFGLIAYYKSVSNKVYEITPTNHYKQVTKEEYELLEELMKSEKGN